VLPEFEEKLRKFWAVVCKPRDHQEINRIVSAHTKGMIPDLLSRNHECFLFLSVMYYEGSWLEQMNPNDTYLGDFIGYNGAPSQPVLFMHIQSKMKSCKLEYSKAVLKPYTDKFVAVFVQPNQASEQGMREALYELSTFGSGEGVLNVLLESPSLMLDLSMPKMTVQYTGDLEESCRQLGISAVFETQAMTMALEAGSNGVVSAMPVQVRFEMDEKGVRCAAAAAAGGTRGGGPPSVVLDKPFILCLFHAPSKTPLLLAQIHSVR